MTPIRVISGKAKGRKLKMVPGQSTRPITDRVKESLFNIIRMELPDCSFLDIFAGTGSVGIEALSRGAKYVRFVEINRTAIRIIKENLEITEMGEGAEIFQMDAFALLSKPPDHQFDYLYIAPPQFKDMWKKTLLALDKVPDWMVDDGWVVVQIDPKEYEQMELSNFSEFDRRKYGRTMLVFYERELLDG
jgi:16S rRNA (guanine(966)-N(2))-methyltransferase RsmD